MSPPTFRHPSHLSAAQQQFASFFASPLEPSMEGDWHLLRSSQPNWRDKRNVIFRYASTSTPTISDSSYWNPLNSDADKSMAATSLPGGENGTFVWRGSGIARLVSVRWEVLSFTTRDGDEGDWMLVYLAKSTFTSPAVNLLCRKKEGLGAEDAERVKEWLEVLSGMDLGVKKAVDGMFDIKRE